MNKEQQDLAWAALPSEARKRARREYAYHSQKKATGAVNALGNIFGHHNLISDTEPEEMLTVPRKMIQEEYEKAIYGHENAKHDSPEESYYLAMQHILSDLFPDKCLPDPSEELEQTLEQIVQVDEKPTPKFKVGDKVKVINDSDYNGIITQISEVQTRICGGFYYYLKDLVGTWTDDAIEPYTEPKFKIGDKVRILECDRIGYVAVVQISDDGYVYELTDSNSRLIGIYNATEIESYTEPEPQQTKDMEEKELNLLTLLKGCENETIYMPDEGLVTIERIDEERRCIRVNAQSGDNINLVDETLRIKFTGFDYIYPSKEAFLKYPLEAAKAWQEWSESRRPKRWRAKDGEHYYRFDAMFSCVKEMENEGSTDNTYYGHGNYFQTREECFKAAEAVKRTLIEFHKKNAEK